MPTSKKSEKLTEVEVKRKIELSKPLRLYLWLLKKDFEQEYLDYRYSECLQKLLKWKISIDYMNGYIESMLDRMNITKAVLNDNTLKLNQKNNADSNN